LAITRLSDAVETASVNIRKGSGSFFGLDDENPKNKQIKDGAKESKDTNTLVKSVAEKNSSTSKLDNFRKMLDAKNASSHMYHKNSRLNQCESNGFKSGKIIKKFKKRMQEV